MGPSATGSLADGSASNTMTISGTTATFSSPIPDNVGVGDAIQYDDDGDDDIDALDSIIFIHGRTSDTVYTVATAAGGTPTAVTDEQQWNIFRAYTSLSNAETGTENTGIDSDLVNFDTFTTGKDLTNTTGSNEQWNIACYANGTTADTTAVDIDGWTTDSDNFIRIFTPYEKNQVGISQRHAGVWDTSKYHIQVTGTVLRSREENTRVEGLQVYKNDGNDTGGIYMYGATGTADYRISDNIVRAGTLTNDIQGGIAIYDAGSGGTARIWNNIVYDVTMASGIIVGINLSDPNIDFYLYNNTLHNNRYGVYADTASSLTLKNNIANSSGTGCYYTAGSFSASSTNNICELNAAEGTFGATADAGTTTSTTTSKLVQTGQNFLTTIKVGMVIANTTDTTYTYVTAVDSDTQLSINDDIFASGENYTIYTNMYGAVTFTDEASDNFHLATSDTLAQNKGADLSADSNLAFSTDIDEHTRVLDWDIGADQLEPTEFTSIVDPDNGTGTDYTSLASWETGVQTSLTSSATKVFSGTVTNSISDGDSVDLYRGGSDTGIDGVAVHVSSSQILVENISNTAAGFESGDTWVEAGVSSDYFTISNTGDSAIAVAECRSTGGTADTYTTTGVVINDASWATSETNYIKIWTDPTDAFGRHNGQWDDSVYRIETTNAIAIMTEEDYVRIDGLQIYTTSASSNNRGAIYVRNSGAADSDFYFSNNILRGPNASSASYTDGIQVYTAGAGTVYAWNNIIYDYSQTSQGGGITSWDGDFTVYAFNNTIHNSSNGIYISNGTVIAKNNIVQDCTDGFYGTFGFSSDYNISDIASDTTGGSNDQANTTVTFVGEAIDDFHLSSDDTAAKNAGLDLLSDPNLNFTDDVDGTTRGASWDIGADEASIEFVATVMESGGDFTSLFNWENTIDVDLTSSATRVFSHGGVTGTISHNDTVTGATSGATATVTYATSTQILLDTISGNFQSGEQVYQTQDTNYVVISSGDEPAIAVAKIDGLWSATDTTDTTINHWTTDHDNYIKIYTTEIARHDGAWDTNAYRRSQIIIEEEFLWIDGLQFEDEGPNYNFVDSDYSELKFSNNIIENDNFYISSNAAATYKIWNNVIQNYSGTSAAMYVYSNKAYIYNNTVYGNGGYGIRRITGDVIAVNNIVTGTTSDSYYGTYATGTDYNFSGDADSPGVGSNNQTNQTFNFVDESNNDFHLASKAANGVNEGFDISSSATLNVIAGISTDIDGAVRGADGQGWDVGADEVANPIYRSVGPSNTSALDDDNSHADTVTLSSGTATFSAAVSDNVGVGDVVLIDTGGTNQTIDSADTLLFISGRTNSTVFTLQTASGVVPANIAVNDTWEIYRAHTSLSSAETGTINTTVSGLGFSFAGGNRNLITNNEQWNIACYNDATDTTPVLIDGWTTGGQNYIHVFAPQDTTEVGVTQRHIGKVGTGYRIYIVTNYSHAIETVEDYVRIDGLEIRQGASGDSEEGIRISANGAQDIRILNSIVWSDNKNTTDQDGIYAGLVSAIINVQNTIVYGFTRAGIHPQMYTGSGYEQTWNIDNVTAYNNGTLGESESGGITTTVDAGNIANVNINNMISTNTTQGEDYEQTAAGTHNWNIDNSICEDSSITNRDSGAQNPITSTSVFDRNSIPSANENMVIYEDITPGGEDLHLVGYYSSGEWNNAIDAGVPLVEDAITDNFNRSNANPEGMNWTTITGQDAVQISGNALYGTVTYGGAYYNKGEFGPDQYSQAVKGNSSDQVGVLARVSTSAQSYYRFMIIDSSTATLGKYVNGTWTQIGANITGTYASGDVIRIEVEGTTIRCLQNGNVIRTDTDSDLTEGRPGVRFHNITASLDDWQGGNIVDSETAFSTDIDGHVRTDWDIGADEASIEFNPTVMESGGDYSSLASWETGMQTDLTADATRVFSHGGITGSIADNDTVTGETSGATATVAHATTSGILLESISGTFQSGEQVYQTLDTNYVTISNNGNPAHAVAKIDGSWTGADTTAFDINGWTTGPNNYVKIYTTSTARHAGVWDSNKYRMEFDSAPENLGVFENYVRIDGLQIYSSYNNDSSGINFDITTSNIGETYLSNSIVRGNNQTGYTNRGINFAAAGTGSKAYVWNNIIYDTGNDSTNDAGIWQHYSQWDIYAYNNTIDNAYYGIHTHGDNGMVAKNNIAQNCTDGFHIGWGSWGTGSGYNISDVVSDTTGNSTDRDGTQVAFIDETNDNFHLDDTEIYARGNGADLWSNADKVGFADDIDGDTRPTGGWDIGADQAPTKIYRSVGPSSTSAIDDNSSGTETVTISGSTATFSAAIVDNVGVGDVLVYDSDNDGDVDSNDSAVFIYGRNSSTSYIVKDEDGSEPDNAVTDDDDWLIYRAYTSLANAESGTINTGISARGLSFTGGNRDLVANNEQWNIACYGDAVDSTQTAINGWTAGESNYIRVFTPYTLAEVGTSQRHQGTWNTSYYNLSVSTDWYALDIVTPYVRLEGLQIETTSNGNSATGLAMETADATGDVRVDSCIVRATGSGNGSRAFDSNDTTSTYLINSVFHQMGTPGSNEENYAISGYGANIWIYSSVVTGGVGNGTGIGMGIRNRGNGTINIKNSAVFNNGDDFYTDTATTNVDYCASDDGDGTNPVDISPGATESDDWANAFVDYVNGDFHIRDSSSVLYDAGTDTTSESVPLNFILDIDGEARAYSTSWDIGADESTKTNLRIRGGVNIDGGVRISN